MTDDAADTVEVHLIDWSGDLRGKVLPVYFEARIRAEIRFDGLPALKEAVARDIEEARLRLQGKVPKIGDPVLPPIEGIR
ncbi:MAG: riboflavin kinase [Candidatus Eisenbacteria bacterium]|nr:riboflavin kinase [Candidatus Eisenbacteria bacterium]